MLLTFPMPIFVGLVHTEPALALNGHPLVDGEIGLPNLSARLDPSNLLLPSWNWPNFVIILCVLVLYLLTLESYLLY